jgi:hypothetical protein
MGSTQPREYNWLRSYFEEILAAAVQKIANMAVGIRHADYATHPAAIVGTNFAGKRWSHGRYSSLAD